MHTRTILSYCPRVFTLNQYRSTCSLSSSSHLTKKSLPRLATASAALFTTAATATASNMPKSTETKQTEQKELSYDTFTTADVIPLTFDGKRAVEHEPVSLGSLIPDGGVVFLVRRPGCWLCRAEAKSLIEAVEKQRAKGQKIKLIGIVKENLDNELAEFAPHFANHPLYMDPKMDLYNLIGRRKISFGEYFTKAGFKFAWNSVRSGVGGNFKGEGLVKGGFVIVGSKEQGILHVHREQGNDQPNWTEVAAVFDQLPATDSDTPHTKLPAEENKSSKSAPVCDDNSCKLPSAEESKSNSSGNKSSKPAPVCDNNSCKL